MLRPLCFLAVLGFAAPGLAETQFVTCDNGVRCIKAPCPSRDTVEIASGKRYAGVAVDVSGLSDFDKARKDLDKGLYAATLVLAGSVVGNPPENGQIEIKRVVRASTAREIRLCWRRK